MSVNVTIYCAYGVKEHKNMRNLRFLSILVTFGHDFHGIILEKLILVYKNL